MVAEILKPKSALMHQKNGPRGYTLMNSETKQCVCVRQNTHIYVYIFVIRKKSQYIVLT